MKSVMQKLTVVVSIFIFFTPLLASAGGLVPCGGPDQPECQTCHVIQLADNVIDWLIMILSIVAGILIAYAGILLVVSQGNSASYEKAKKVFSNVIIGYAILLACWLLVDTVVKSFLNDQVYGTWNQIQCVDQPVASEADKVNVYLGSPITNKSELEAVYGTGYQQALFGGNVSLGVGDCSPANLQRLGMNATQARVFSCIAMPESGCRLDADNPNSTARGVFQILRGYNNQCHNLNLPQCTEAARRAGWNGSGDLNCSTAFRRGHAIPNNPLAAVCDAAASDLGCNVAAALCLYNDGGGYNHWLGEKNKDHHREQRACVAAYGN